MSLYWITIRFYGTWKAPANGRRYANKPVQAAFYCCRPVGRLIEGFVRETCEQQEWTLFDCVAMPTHVHILFGAPAPQQRAGVVGRIKSHITRSLRAASVIESDRRIWGKRNDRYEVRPMSELARLMEYCARNRLERDS